MDSGASTGPTGTMQKPDVLRNVERAKSEVRKSSNKPEITAEQLGEKKNTDKLAGN